MKTICLSVLLLLVSLNVLPQKNDYSWLTQPYNRVSYNEALLIKDNARITYDELLNIPDSNILSVEVYNARQAKKRFKEEGKKGAVIIKTKAKETFDYILHSQKIPPVIMLPKEIPSLPGCSVMQALKLMIHYLFRGESSCRRI